MAMKDNDGDDDDDK